MSKLYTLVGRLWAWLLPSAAARGTAAAALSPGERLLQHREHLFDSAVQLLDDEAAAQQVVLEALGQAVSQPLLPVKSSGPVPGTGEAAAGEQAAEQHLVSWLDRLVVNLAVTRLQALSAVGVGRGLSQDGWSAVREFDGADPASLAGPPVAPAAPADSTDRAFPGSAGGAGAGALPAVTPSFALAGEQAQLQRTAHVLSQLPTQMRVTLMLVAMQGRSVAEVAELLGCSVVTCRFWLSHGLKLMRRALQRDLVEDDFVSRESRLLLSPGALNDLRRSKKAAARA